jgi:hypothetical protein
MKWIKRFESFIIEKDLIVSCDIQAEYQKAMRGDFIERFVQFINMNSEKTIIFLFNGETVGGPSEYQYKEWLLDIGIDYDLIEESYVFDKGYGQIRELMDSGIEEDKIVDMIRYMLDNNYGDSREMSDDEWEALNINYKNYGYGINEVVDFLGEYDDFVLIGGGKHECLREVELFLDAINKTYHIEQSLVY